MSHKIGWCDETINPGWGCKNKCKYCYARDIAKRFGNDIGIKRDYTLYQREKMKNFELIWFPDKMEIFNEKVKCKKPKRFFIGDMSEIAYWEPMWIQDIINFILINNDYRQLQRMKMHTFQFLTKNPLIYDQFNFPENCWLGWTVTKQADFLRYCEQCGPLFMQSFKNDDNIFFASLEPLHGPINENIVMSFDWVIVGAETGNRKGKKLPKLSWIDDIYQSCLGYKIPVFLKDDLAKAFPGLQLKQEFPEASCD